MTEYLNPIKVQRMNQLGEKNSFIGKIKFKDLIKIHKLTFREENPNDPLSDKVISKSKKIDEYQRLLSEEKLKKISKFLHESFDKKKKLPIFPNATIISLNSKNYSEDSKSYFDKNGSNLFIEDEKDIALIIDGQHRLYGIKYFYDDCKKKLEKEKDTEKIKKLNEKILEAENLDLPAIFLLEYDLYEQGQIFANVNFNQKPVNKSLYYDIFGSIPDPDKNDIRLAHDLVLHLNNNKDSPLFEKINLLGKGDGYFSQALFVGVILRYFKTIWNKIYEDYLRGEDNLVYIAEFMKAYFEIINEKWSIAIPKYKKGKRINGKIYKYNYNLYKSTGIGAILKLIEDLYPRVLKGSKDYVKKQLSPLMELNNKDIEMFFSLDKEGKYKGTGYGENTRLYYDLRFRLLKIPVPEKK